MPATIPVPPDLLLPTLVDLVQIPSVNPGFTGGTGEAELAVYCATCLREAGLDVEVQEVAPGRTNVVGVLRGRGDGPSLMLLGHLDTEAPGELRAPFVARREKGKLFGLGSSDMKAGLSTMLWSAMILAETGLKLGGDLLVALVVDQKVGSLGTRALLERYRPQAALVCECTGLSVGWLHAGSAVLEIETQRSRGSNPVTQMARVVLGLDELDRRLASQPTPEGLGPPSFRPSAIFSAAEWGAQPRQCRLRAERRLLPGEAESQAEAELTSLLKGLAGGDPTFRAKLAPSQTASRPAYHHPPTSPLLGVLEQAVTRTTDLPARRTAHPGWTDAALLQAAGIPALVFGPAGEAGDEEWVLEDSLGLAAEVLVEVALSWCRAS